MYKHRTNSFTRAATITATALTLFAGSSAAFGTEITWKGVTFDTFGSGTANIDSDDHLLLTPDTNDGFGIHLNRIPGGDSDTPFISFSFLDPGISGQNIDVAIQDETVTGQPRIAAGSLFGATQAVSATYGSGSERNDNEEYLFYTQPREATSHDVVLGKTADSTLYAIFDGEQRSSDIFKDAGIGFDFNDLHFRARGAGGDTIRFTDFAYGEDFSPSGAQDVPEPGSFAMLGLGVFLLGFLGFRRRC